MLLGASCLKGFRADATDREVGIVRDVFFDDVDWAVQYIAIDTAGRFPRRKLLVPAAWASHADAGNKRLTLCVAAERLGSCPEPASRTSLSRPETIGLAQRLIWPDDSQRGPTGPGGQLRSAEDVSGYLVRALDRESGCLCDLLVDDAWQIEYLIVKLRPLMPGGMVVVERRWAASLNPAERTIGIALPAHALQSAPEYSGELPDEQADRIRQYYASWRAAA
ncbi:MAG: PRC-barrel domain-containing protein [bacterium]|jgi:hypothetical protein